MQKFLRGLALPGLVVLLMLLLAACGSNATSTGTQSPGSPTITPTTNSIPTATPSVPVTPSATPTQAAALKLDFTCNTATAGGSGPVKICVKTHPGASLTIKVTYCDSVVDNSKSLQGTFMADPSGNHTWNWNEPEKCNGQGVWKKEVDVTATFGGQTTSMQSVGQA